MSDKRPLILVAERDLFIRSVLRRTLGEHFELDFVEDGGLVLERAKERQPALVILAALLPRMDGFQVCEQLKGDPATRHIPVLFYSWLLVEEQAARAGADAFLMKPAPGERLLATINRLLAGRLEGEREGK